MKAAIVRGASLNPWEMQTYEALNGRVELLGIASKFNKFELKKIKFPFAKLHCLGDYFSWLPGGIKLLYKHLGDPQFLIGFDNIVKGYDIVHSAEIRSAYSLQAVRAKRKGLVRAVTLAVFENIFLDDKLNARRRLKQEVIAGVDYFLASSQGARETLIREGVEREKIGIVYPGIDCRKFRPRLKTDKKRLQVRKKYNFSDQD